MFRTLCLMTGIATLGFAHPARAEKAPMSPEELLKKATHVVTGKVAAVYSRAAKDGDWQYTHYVAEVKVDACEKGDGIKKGEPVYVRYWRRSWAGEGRVPPSTAGHRGLPAEGAAVRVYLARNAYDGFGDGNTDGGFNVIGANGFEALKASPAK